MTEGSRPRVQRFATAAEFIDAAGPFLVEREAEHNLMFGICSNLIADPHFPIAPPYLATISTSEQVVGAVVMTPPWNIVLSLMEHPDALAALIADLDAGGLSLPGVTGPAGVVGPFAEAWARAHDLTSRRAVAERIYRLERVIPPSGVRGRGRVGTPADRDLLVAWVGAFMDEALDRSPEEASVVVDRSFRMKTRTWYLWEDDEPVSVAAAGGPTPNGIRIGPVYTPPDRRRNGYASAVTALASQTELEAGRRFVFLFTDLSNPTSNKIYQQIGYEPIIDVDLLTFEPRQPTR